MYIPWYTMPSRLANLEWSSAMFILSGLLSCGGLQNVLLDALRRDRHQGVAALCKVDVLISPQRSAQKLLHLCSL